MHENHASIFTIYEAILIADFNTYLLSGNNWVAAMDDATSSNTNPSGVQGICPDGWHLPSRSEWEELEIYLGMSPSVLANTGWRGTNEGGKLKERGNEHWKNPNSDATNEFGFNALPSGYRYQSDFNGIGESAVFWASNDGGMAQFADHRRLSFDTGKIFMSGTDMSGALSVRCVKD